MTQPTGAKGFGFRLAQERRLKAAREERDIQQQDVAREMGVANSTYGRWEGGTIPGEDRIEQLARYFGVTPAFLHYGQLPREPEELPEITITPELRPATEEEAVRIEEEIRRAREGREGNRKANGGRGRAG